MTEQRPLNRAFPSTYSLDGEPLSVASPEVGDEAVGPDASGHIALMYESQDELFAGAIPFIQAGLERGDHCWYVVDDTTKEAVVAALRAGGIDVEGACAAGNLAILSPSETYGEASEFDAAAMVETWEDRIAEAITEEGYEGFRIAGEATWELGTDGLIDGVRDYESQLTECFAREDCLAMCMYNRERFPAAVLDDVIQHHPQVVYDSTVTQNVYYVPPDEEHPQQAVERQLQTLVTQTTALEDRTNKIEEAHTQLEAAASAGSVGLWTWDIQDDNLTADEYVAASYGIDPATAATGTPIEEFFDSVLEDDRERVAGQVDKAVEQTGELETEYRVWNADGNIMWLVARGEVDYAADGEPLRLHGAISDITERKRQEQLQAEQTRLLEDIAQGASLEECLSSLCSSISRLNPGTKASILLADEEREAFQHSIAPDLQPSWAEGLEGEPITDLMIGTNGEAVFRGTSVTCEDVTTDDRWAEDWRNLCVANGILAGHSAPIRDENGDPLGSFMLCFDEPKAPTEWDKRLADFGTHIASIAIERDRSRRALRESEERYQTLFESVPVAAFVCDDAAIIQHYNRRAAELWDREPTRGDPDERYCGSQALYLPDGTRLPHEESPMVEVLQDGTPIHNVEVSMEQPDGSRIPIIANFSPLTDAQGNTTGVITTFEDITERKQHEQQLTRQHGQIEHLKDRLLETSPTGIVVLDSANEVTLANDRAEDILGMPREDLIGLPYDTSQFDFVDVTGEPLSDADLPFERIRTTGDSVFGVELGLNPNGHRIWLSINATPLSDEQAHEPTKTVVAFKDITDHKRANDALEHLNDTSRELMNAEPQAISEQAAGITQEVLDVPYASLWRYDEATGDLQLQTASTTSGIDTESIRFPEKFVERAWQTFVSTELDASNEFPPAPDTGASEEPIRSGVIVPLGRHGVICAGSLSPGAFDETTVDLAETVAATIETTLDRAADEQELARQNEELTHLDRLNSIIREIDQALVQAETREEIDRVVCEQLSASDLYEFAWMGETDPGTDTIVPREWAGIDPGYLDQLTITTDDTPTGQGPIGTALRTCDPQVVQDIITASRFAPWREHTLEQDVRSCISIPLVYNDTLYGVVTVYAEDPLTNERHHDVLAELGETVANAISSVETKQALQTDSVVELKLQVREPDTILSRLAQQLSCQIEFEGFVSHSAETAQVFITTHGASADEICTAAAASLAIETVTTLSESEAGCRVKLVITDPPLASVLIDQDAEIRQLTLDADGATAVVALPTTRDVRSVIETVQTTFPETELVSRRTCPQSREPLHTRRAIYEKSLTDRQQDTLRTAYLSGFFESPRETTGQEIADAMDVSQPTFVQHLRAGQRNLFEMLFDGIE